MAIQAQRGDSCIWGYLSGVSWGGKPEKALHDFFKMFKSQGTSWNKSKKPLTPSFYSYYVFSGVTEEKYSNELAEYIRTYGLGTVYQTNPTENWSFHPGRKGQIFVWATDYDKICDWFEALEKGEEPKKPFYKADAVVNTTKAVVRKTRKKNDVEEVAAPEGAKRIQSRRKK